MLPALKSAKITMLAAKCLLHSLIYCPLPKITTRGWSGSPQAKLLKLTGNSRAGQSNLNQSPTSAIWRPCLSWQATHERQVVPPGPGLSWVPPRWSGVVFWWPIRAGQPDLGMPPDKRFGQIGPWSMWVPHRGQFWQHGLGCAWLSRDGHFEKWTIDEWGERARASGWEHGGWA